MIGPPIGFYMCFAVHMWKICEGEPVIVDRQHRVLWLIPSPQCWLVAAWVLYQEVLKEEPTRPWYLYRKSLQTVPWRGSSLQADKWEAAQEGSGSWLALLCWFSPSKARIWGLATLGLWVWLLGLHGAAICPNSLYPEGSLKELRRPSSVS